ncbi:hypothetical protein WJX84_008411 [Apatococcus fuscideae]|uniref:Uncharacterized protein n=1 Tax=Apatococcus fuscideae TaxID=2026836 RepID=A0AAW1T1F4_9CHLO
MRFVENFHGVTLPRFLSCLATDPSVEMGGSSSRNQNAAVPEPVSEGDYGRLYRVSGAKDAPHGLQYQDTEANPTLRQPGW